MLNMNNVIKLKYDYNTYAHMKEVNTKLLLFANNLKYLNNLEILHFGKYFIYGIYRWELCSGRRITNCS